MQANATYSDSYLNQSGMNGYKDFELLYGARAEAVEVTDLLPLHGLFLKHHSVQILVVVASTLRWNPRPHLIGSV